MARVNVPGTSDWFELADISILTSDHQFDLDELRDGLIEAKRRRLAASAPPPANPAVMADPADTDVRLAGRDLIPVYELVLGWVVTDSSRGLPVKFPLAAGTWNVLRAAVAPYFATLNGAVAPKAETDQEETGESTSTTTSPEPVPALPAEPAQG